MGGGGGGQDPPNVLTRNVHVTYLREQAPQKHIFKVSKYICIHIQLIQFPFITYMVWPINDSILTNDKTFMNMRVSGASELRKYLYFYFLKLLFPSIFHWYFRYFVSETYLFSGFKMTSAYIIQSMQFPFITYGIYGAIYRVAKEKKTDQSIF